MACFVAQYTVQLWDLATGTRLLRRVLPVRAQPGAGACLPCQPAAAQSLPLESNSPLFFNGRSLICTASVGPGDQDGLVPGPLVLQHYALRY